MKSLWTSLWAAMSAKSQQFSLLLVVVILFVLFRIDVPWQLWVALIGIGVGGGISIVIISDTNKNKELYSKDDDSKKIE